jgi:hypothetical protein
MWQVAKTRPVVWLTFLCAMVIQVLVNNVENSFARTLVNCDVPVVTEPGALFAGSAYCGDRLRVLNEGSMLSGLAQSQECLCKLIAMIVCAATAEVYGRKPILIIGLCCTGLSVWGFVLATCAREWARTLFILGQALQGACPTDLLLSLVAVDLAKLPDADSAATYQLQGFLTVLSYTIAGLVAVFLQSMDIINYTPLWLVMASICVIVVILTRFYFPETRFMKDNHRCRQDDETCIGVLSHKFLSASETHGLHSVHPAKRVVNTVVSELRSYGELLITDRFARTRLSLYTLSSIGGLFRQISIAYAMAYYRMSFAKVIMMLLCSLPVSLLAMPLCKAVHERIGFWRCWLSFQLLMFLTSSLHVLLPLGVAFWMAQIFACALCSGFPALVTLLEQEVMQDNINKYTTLKKMLELVSQIVGGPLFASLFDAKATEYLFMAKPNLFAFACMCSYFVLLFAPSMGVIQPSKTCLDRMEHKRQERKASQYRWTETGIKFIEPSNERFPEATVGAVFSHKDLIAFRANAPEACLASLCKDEIIAEASSRVASKTSSPHVDSRKSLVGDDAEPVTLLTSKAGREKSLEDKKSQ